MNPEFLSDGLLFESEAEWERAFQKDPQGSAKALVKLQRSFSEELAAWSERFSPTSPQEILGACTTLLDELISALPKEGNLFPSESEKRAILPSVCRFLSRLQELAPGLWSFLERLSSSRESLEKLLNKNEDLQSVLSPAVAASAEFALSPDPKEALTACKQDKEAILFHLGQIIEQKGAVEMLHKRFFREFADELSSAADLEHDGASASPAKVLAACGYAKQALNLIFDQTSAASPPQSPDA